MQEPNNKNTETKRLIYKTERINRMSEDPVCGMSVDEKKTSAESEYKGKTYHICARGCKLAFGKEPEKYTGTRQGGHSGAHDIHS